MVIYDNMLVTYIRNAIKTPYNKKEKHEYIDRQTKNCQGAGCVKSGAYNSGANSAYSLSTCGLDRSAYGLATSVSTQLWAWPSNLCIEPLQKLLYQI